MFRFMRQLFFVLMLTLSILINVLSVTSTVFNAALTGLIATTLGVKTVTAKLHSRTKQLESQRAMQKESVRKMGNRLASRSKRIAAFSVGEIPASFIPFAGITLIAVGTAWELKQLCDSLKDMETLYRDMGIEESLDDESFRAVCHPSSWFNFRRTDQ
jgi:hypothetical protein